MVLWTPYVLNDLSSNGTAWLVAITGFIVGIGTLILNRRGQKEQSEQIGAANQIARDKGRLEETEQAITSLERSLAVAQAEAERYRTLWREAEDENDDQRDRHRAEYAAQEKRCREYANDLTDAIAVLKRSVTDPIVVDAADRMITTRGHPHGPTLEQPATKEDEHDADEHADLDG